MTRGLMLMQAAIFALSLAFAGALHAEADDEYWTHERVQGNEKPPSRRWADVIGRKVVVEGIAWGSVEKGAGAYIILNHARVYVEGDFLQQELEGRLVRATGVLSAETISARKANSPGPDRDVRLFRLKEVKLEAIDRVEWPWLRQADPK